MEQAVVLAGGLQVEPLEGGGADINAPVASDMYTTTSEEPAAVPAG